MATRNVVPRAAGEGSIGTALKPWGDGQFDALHLGGGDVASYLAESTGYGIISGCEPTISGLTVTVGAGIVHLANGTRKEIASTNITLDVADSTNPRIDLVYIDSTGTVAKITGTAAASPSAPTIPQNSIPIALINVKTERNVIVDIRKYISKSYNKFGFGIYCNNWYFTYDRLTTFANAGIDTVRFGFPWQQLEPTAGQYAIASQMDWPLSQLALFNMTPIICIGGGNTNYGTVAGHIDNQTAITAYATAAQKLAEFAFSKNIHNLVIEVLNEPDENSGFIDYANYVQLVKATYDAVKLVNPNYSVIAYANTSTGSYDFNRKCFELGIADFCDAFALHIYSSTAPEIDRKRIEKFKTDYARYTTRKLQYYVTETGYETLSNSGNFSDKYATESNRAKWLPRRILALMQDDDVIRACIHVDITSYTGDDGENYFGMWQAASATDEPYTPTSTWLAVANFGAELKGYSIIKTLYYSEGYNELLVEKDNTYKIVAWTAGDSFDWYIEGVKHSISDTPKYIPVINPNVFLNLNGKFSDKCGFSYGKSGAEVHNDYYLNAAFGGYSTARGTGVTARGTGAFASGVESFTNADYAFAHGYRAKASGIGSVACGLSAETSSNGCVAIGQNVISSGYATAVFGFNNTASGQQNIVGGVNNNVAGNYSLVIGSGHNIPSTIFSAGIFGTNCDVKSGNDKILVGNGYATAPTNSFRVESTGNVYCTGTYNTTGADYAEYFEWQDGNANGEDRVGYFVALDNDKIRIAKSTDTYILGIVSGNASVTGNSYNDQWQKMYVVDDFGRIQYEDVEVADVTDEKGNIIFPAHTEKRMKINPEYDNTRRYIGRENRPEWSAIGMLGVLPVRDDGTCEVNGYCKVANGGIATKANSGYRVIKRVSGNVIKIVFR